MCFKSACWGGRNLWDRGKEIYSSRNQIGTTKGDKSLVVHIPPILFFLSAFDVIIPSPPRGEKRDRVRGISQGFDCIVAMYHDQGLIPLKMGGLAMQ